MRALQVVSVALTMGLYLPGPGGARQLSSAQAPASHVFRIRVFDGTTNEPISGVSVDFRCFDAYPRSTRFIDTGTGRTDERGEVTTTLAQAGVCMVMNTLKPGFLMRIGENARPTDVGSGEAVRIVHIWKEGRVDGHVQDESGRPVARTPVRLLGRRDSARGPEWVPTAQPSITDDQGAFHFESLSSAVTYSMRVPNMQLVEPAPSLILRPGESQMVNLRVRPVPMFRVAGHAIAPSGGSARVMVSLDSADSSETYLPTTVAMVQADATGRFTFPAVPRGDYRLRVDTGIPVSLPNRLEYSVLWATQPLSVNADLDDVSLPLQRGPEVRGTIRFEGSSSAPTTGRILLSLESADGPGARRVTSGMMEVDAANHFSAVGMLPGRYFLRVALFPDGWRWRLKDAIAQGHDIASVPLVLGSALVDNLVVTFTDRQTDVTGVVRNPQGAEDGEASVLVFSTDEQYWANTGATGRRLRTVLTDQHGKYGVPDLPPGEYFIAAVSTALATPAAGGPDILHDSTRLRQLSSVATRIHVEYDRPVSQDLTRVAIPSGALRASGGDE